MGQEQAKFQILVLNPSIRWLIDSSKIYDQRGNMA